jgi:hypothetical protein
MNLLEITTFKITIKITIKFLKIFEDGFPKKMNLNTKSTVKKYFENNKTYNSLK